MAPRTEQRVPKRPRLSKERVLRAALRLADAGGVDAISMRKLAQELGVEAMSLYNHVAGKDEILDGIIDLVVGEIDLTPSDAGWKEAMRHRSMTARKVILRHPWAPRLIFSRPRFSPVMMRYFESITGILRRGGFSGELTHHAMHILGSRILGFTQELFEEIPPEMAADFAAQVSTDDYPYIAELIGEISHDDDTEFEFGLDLILDGLDALRTRE